MHPVGWRTSLRVFILYANPVALSFGAALRKQAIGALRSRGHEINDCDLYAESFDPVMREQERMQYHDVELNRAPIAPYADRLLAAEALVLIYPVWNEGFPAILKGFFDRVFIPGVIPRLVDQDPWAQLRRPMDMIRQGWSTRLFQASQQWSTISSYLKIRFESQLSRRNCQTFSCGLSSGHGQGLDLLETRGWVEVASGVVET